MAPATDSPARFPGNPEPTESRTTAQRTQHPICVADRFLTVATRGHGPIPHPFRGSRCTRTHLRTKIGGDSHGDGEMVDPEQIRGQLDEVAKTYAALALEKRDPGERETYLQLTLADVKDEALKGGMGSCVCRSGIVGGHHEANV